MTAIHPHAALGGWRRASHRPRRAGCLVERVLAAVRDWRRYRRGRRQIAALDARISRDIEVWRGDPLDRDREQAERDAWLKMLDFPPF
jgi:uncharacterized protein YjiS (DUF1127 family)